MSTVYYGIRHPNGWVARPRPEDSETAVVIFDDFDVATEFADRSGDGDFAVTELSMDALQILEGQGAKFLLVRSAGGDVVKVNSANCGGLLLIKSGVEPPLASEAGAVPLRSVTLDALHESGSGALRLMADGTPIEQAAQKAKESTNPRDAQRTEYYALREIGTSDWLAMPGPADHPHKLMVIFDNMLAAAIFGAADRGADWGVVALTNADLAEAEADGIGPFLLHRRAPDGTFKVTLVNREGIVALEAGMEPPAA